MKYSIRLKLTLILIAIVSCVILITWFLNLAFAEKYYELSEKNNVIQAYHKIEELLAEADKEDDVEEDDDLGEIEDKEDNQTIKGEKNFFKKTKATDTDEDVSEDTVEEEILNICNRSNIRVMITEADSYLFGQNVLYTNLITDSRGYNELLWYLNQIQTSVLFSNEFSNGTSKRSLDQPPTVRAGGDFLDTLLDEGYVVRMVENEPRGNSGLYLFGYTGNKYFVAMSVSLESIKTSATISSRFLLYIGLIGIVFGSIAMLIVSGRFTRPIKEMAGVADKMAQLDFDAKIDVNTKDELELLGNSMNTLSETLEATIADLKSANLELQKDIEKKEQIDEMRKEFVSHISHELKTPIALIQGYAEGLSENIFDDEESKEFYCEVIADEARKMNVMVQKLLTLNQIESGTAQIELQRFDVCQLIRNKIQSSQILIQKNNNTVEFDEEGPVCVWADEYMIEEVFSNYFSNAIHYVKPGGLIRVWIEHRESDVRIHVYNEGNQIPEEDLEKLWIKFYKVDKARTREYGGSGIGLSIVAASMNAHGKEFGVTNEENGVDFYFDLDT